MGPTARRPRLYVTEWPERDREAWDKAFVTGLIGLEGGLAAAWRPATRSSVEKAYGYWLGWLHQEGRLDPAAGPAARADLQTVETYLNVLIQDGLADHTRAGYLQGLSDALRVMSPEADVAFLRRCANGMRATARRAREIRPRIRPPKDLLEVGLGLMARAEAGEGGSERRNASLFRDGLLLALWVYRALRVSNLANLALDRQLVASGKSYSLEFSADEMKAGRSFGCEWPRGLLPALGVYLEVYRPILGAGHELGPGSGLWLSQSGRTLAVGTVREIIRMRTREVLGEACNPHLIRHAVGTAIAEYRPHFVADVAAILGHSRLETSEHHYNHANGVRAVEAYQEVLLTRMRDGENGAPE